jgi:hypothetical protein
MASKPTRKEINRLGGAGMASVFAVFIKTVKFYHTLSTKTPGEDGRDSANNLIRIGRNT